MLNYFIKNKRGVVSVFVAIILVVTMSFSSLMVEIGRARSVNSIVSQITESAAFSTLSKYDRDLYKRFALMALSPDIEEGTFENYVRASLNEGIDNPISIEQSIKAVDIKVDKMYPLANPNVIRAQIEEAWKYRGPYNLAEGTLNLEKSITDYIKNLEKASTVITFFKSIATMTNDIVTCVEKVVTFTEDYDNYKEKNTAYESGVDTYNSAIDTYNNDIAALDTESETYEEDKQSIESAMSSAGETFQDQIQDLIDSTESLTDSLDDMFESVQTIFSDGVSINLQKMCLAEKTKIENGNSGEYSSWTGEEKAKYKKLLSTMADPSAKNEFTPILKDIQDSADKFKEISYDNFTEGLKSQKESIKPTWTKEDVVKVEIGFIFGVTLLFSALSFIFNVAQKIINFFKAVYDAFVQFIDIIKGVSMLINWPMGDFSLNGSISSIVTSLPSNNSSTVGQLAVVTSDETMVTKRINETTDVANKVGYDTRYVNPTIDNSDIGLMDKANQLNVAVSNFSNATFKLGDELQSFNIHRLISVLVETIIAAVEVVTCMCSFLGECIRKFTTSALQTIYSKLIIADYAVMQFPNRTSNTASGKDSLGNSWSTYSAYWLSNNDFTRARAEYIFAGDNSEISNQFLTFGIMYIVRGASNILPLFLNDILQKLTEDTMVVCPFNFILIIIIAFIFWVMETLMDMVLLTWGQTKLPLVKLDLWCFSVDGSKELLKKLKGILKSQKFADSSLIKSVFPSTSSASDSSNEKTYIEDTATKFNTEIGYWGYTDYLRIMIAFKSQEKVVLRIADMIQLEMGNITQKEYKMSKAYTYIRTDTTVNYNPLLPVLSIPEVKDKVFSLKRVYYAGY